MATKYILHGGYAGHVNGHNDKFFQEILKDTPNELNILLVYFAKEEDRVSVNQAEDEAQFEKNKGERKLTYVTANEDEAAEQIRKADVVYLHGGTTLKLLQTLKKVPNLKELFKGKIVAGESAGAYVLSQVFFSKTAGGVFDGLGMVPVKTICHYEGVNRERLEKLEDKLELLLLKDYEFKVFRI